MLNQPAFQDFTPHNSDSSSDVNTGSSDSDPSF